MKPKVLVVDDEQFVIDGIRRLLHPRFEVHGATSGDAGLTTMKTSGPFEIVIADMRMPKMNGIEFLTKARIADPNAIYMMLTGNADHATAVDAVEVGHVFQFLAKPCSEGELEKALSSALELHALQTKLDTIKTGKSTAA